MMTAMTTTTVMAIILNRNRKKNRKWHPEVTIRSVLWLTLGISIRLHSNLIKRDI